MKKRYGVVIMVGLLLAVLSPIASGDPGENGGEVSRDLEIKQIPQTSKNFCNDGLYGQGNGYGVACVACSEKRLVLRGVWGFQGDNSRDGYLVGRLLRYPRFMVFKGLYNTTDNQEKTRLVGMLRNGFFNGRILLNNDTTCPITGFFKINREQRLVKLRWMTPHQTGWAVANISLVDV
jgi:hypothetical protein